MCATDCGTGKLSTRRKLVSKPALGCLLGRVVVQGLAPSMEYVFKVVCFVGFKETGTHEARVSTSALAEEIVPNTAPDNSHSPVTNCSTLSNPSSVEDEMNNITSGLIENSMDRPINRVVQDRVSASKGKHAPSDAVYDQSGATKTRLEVQPCPPPEEMPTPCRIDILGTVRRNRRSRSSKEDAGDTFRNSEDQPRPSSSSKKRCSPDLAAPIKQEGRRRQ